MKTIGNLVAENLARRRAQVVIPRCKNNYISGQRRPVRQHQAALIERLDSAAALAYFDFPVGNELAVSDINKYPPPRVGYFLMIPGPCGPESSSKPASVNPSSKSLSTCAILLVKCEAGMKHKDTLLRREDGIFRLAGA
ncbi:hypothetical protein MBR_08543, partial [Metarhizium brunneum ARSEF 3297]